MSPKTAMTATPMPVANAYRALLRFMALPRGGRHSRPPSSCHPTPGILSACSRWLGSRAARYAHQGVDGSGNRRRSSLAATAPEMPVAMAS
jgi:hypothetical protein